MKSLCAACWIACLLPALFSAQRGVELSTRGERLKIISWNVLHGFRRGESLEQGTAWLREQAPDVLGLQELNGFREESLRAAAEGFGHQHCALQKDRGYSMGLTSSAPIEVIEKRVEGFHHGYLHARTHGIEFFVVHFWQGKEHEVQHVRDLANSRVRDGAQVVILGDFNSHSRADEAYLATRAIESHYEALQSVQDSGFVDVVHRFDRRPPYSFPSPVTIPRWSKDQAEAESKRQRIDFILVDPGLAARTRAATIERSPALDSISDHYPVAMELAPPERTPLPPTVLSFGVIADCQYCAGPTRGIRRYAASPQKLTACVEHLNLLDLSYVVHLGDFIDRDFESFDVVAPIYQSLDCEAYHVLGNHDYSVADEHKAEVPVRLGMPANYYSFRVRNWRFVVLDGNDVSLYAHPRGSEAWSKAQQYRTTRAPGAPEWNGALGADQLAWLEEILGRADAADEKVVVFCHFPIYPDDVHNLWNAREVLETLQPHPSVKAYLNGHNHAGNYAEWEGIHFLTLKGMVDTPYTSYAVVKVRGETLSVLGFGRELDRVLSLRPRK